MAYSPNALWKIWDSLGTKFSTTTTYAVDNYVIYEGAFYKCTAAHTGAWDPAHFSEVTIASQLGGTSSVEWTPVANNFSTSSPYTKGDLVINEGKLYRANADMAAGTWDPTKWTQTNVVSEMPSVEIVAPAFDPTKAYVSGDKVTKNGKLWIAPTNIAAGAWDASKWTNKSVSDVFLQAAEEWQLSKTYHKNDVVQKDGNLWICNVTDSNPSEFITVPSTVPVTTGEIAYVSADTRIDIRDDTVGINFWNYVNNAEVSLGGDGNLDFTLVIKPSGTSLHYVVDDGSWDGAPIFCTMPDGKLLTIMDQGWGFSVLYQNPDHTNAFPADTTGGTFTYNDIQNAEWEIYYVGKVSECIGERVLENFIMNWDDIANPQEGQIVWSNINHKAYMVKKFRYPIPCDPAIDPDVDECYFELGDIDNGWIINRLQSAITGIALDEGEITPSAENLGHVCQIQNFANDFYNPGALYMVSKIDDTPTYGYREYPIDHPHWEIKRALDNLCEGLGCTPTYILPNLDKDYQYAFSAIPKYYKTYDSEHTTTAYAVGDRVTENGKFYMCKTACTGGTWEPTNWVEVIPEEEQAKEAEAMCAALGLTRKAPVWDSVNNKFVYEYVITI